MVYFKKGNQEKYNSILKPPSIQWKLQTEHQDVHHHTIVETVKN